MKYAVNYSAVSHIGRLRSNNQDNFICDGTFMNLNAEGEMTTASGQLISGSSSLLGVFDGLGGEECGEVASYIAAKLAASVTPGEDAVGDLSDYCENANRAICSFAEKHEIRSMGTTAAILAFGPKQITLCNLGDSKIFSFSGGRLQQISKDHIAQAPYGRKAPLSQNLGIPPDELIIDPYFALGDYHSDDLYLLCTDGLTDMVSTEDITEILLKIPFHQAVDVLLNTALDNGGKDNITIILCQVQRKKPRLFDRVFRSIHREDGEERNGS